MAGSRRNAEINIDVTGADDARVDVKKVESAFDQLGEGASAAAQPIIRSLERIQEKHEKASNDMATVTAKDVASMVRNFAVLESQILDTFDDDVTKAPKELQEALGKAEAQVKKVTQEFGALDDAVGDNSANVKVAGDNWPGLGAAIEGVGGKMGTAAAKVGLVGAAFREGVQAGMEFNRAIGTDMSEAESAMARFGAGAKIILEGVSDGIVDIARLTKEFFTFSPGWEDRVLNAYGELEKTQAKNAATLKNLSAAIDAEVSAQERAKAAADATAEAQRKAEQAAKKLADEKERLKEKIDDVVRSMQKETIEIAKQQEIAADASRSVTLRSSDVAYYARQVDGATRAIEEQREKVEALESQFGSHNPLVNQAREKQQDLERALRSAEQRYEDGVAVVKRYEDQQRDAERAVESGKRKIEDLKEKQAELTTVTNTAATAAGTAATQQQAAATGTAAVATAVDTAKPKVESYKDEMGRWHVVTAKAADAAKGAAEGIEAIGDAGANVGATATAIEGVGRATGTLRASVADVDSLTAAFERLRLKANEARDAVARVSEAGDDAPSLAPSTPAAPAAPTSPLRSAPSSSIQ